LIARSCVVRCTFVDLVFTIDTCAQDLFFDSELRGWLAARCGGRGRIACALATYPQHWPVLAPAGAHFRSTQLPVTRASKMLSNTTVHRNGLQPRARASVCRVTTRRTRSLCSVRLPVACVAWLVEPQSTYTQTVQSDRQLYYGVKVYVDMGSNHVSRVAVP
jgi:hypothetical protein